MLAPTVTPAIAIPSSRVKGSPSISMRSAKVPLSPSSALQHTYLTPSDPSRHGASSTVRHLIPAGNPAPPRPRRPEARMSPTTSSTGVSRARRSPARPPSFRYSSRSSGSARPTRAKLTRCWRSSHPISSTSPCPSAWSRPSSRPASMSDATSPGATGP